jgi:hypothetical protein
MGLPGVKVGPLDPESTADFGRVSQANNARTLIRLHAQAHPPALTRALARPLDPHRTKGLDLDEVAEYVAGLKHENGDPVLPKGAHVVGAAVHGKSDQQQVLTFVYETETGRTGKWFAEYDTSALPESADAGAEFSRLHELRERGIVAFDEEGAGSEIHRREASRLRRELAAARAQLEGRSEPQGDGESVEQRDPDEVGGDARQTDQIVADLEQARRENAELRERLASLESLAELHGQAQLRGEQPVQTDDVASAEEPIEGYDKLNAHDAIKVLKDEDTDQDTRRRILAYEETHANRRSVVGAGNEALGRAG